MTNSIIIAGFFLGTILGSFAKTLVDRSLANTTFLGRSKCSHCRHPLGILDLVPILSFCFLRGSCRYCRKRINLDYLLVEVGMGILIALVFTKSLENLVFNVFFVTVLAIVFLTDLKEMIIPDRIIIPSTLIATVFVVLTGPFLDNLAMGFFIPLFFSALILITKGQGMGGGDVKLGAFLGVSLGFPNGPLAIILAFISGAFIGVLSILLGRKGLKSHIPFGPFLSLGGLVALLWGGKIINWYLAY